MPQRLIAVTLAAFLLFHGVVVTKSFVHFRLGAASEDAGQVLAAAREYQSAMGYHAPLNPFCRAAAGRLQHLIQSTKIDDPELSADLHDRLQRSLLATRSFYQPHRDLLTQGERPADPNLILFLGALFGLLIGFGAWWWPGLTVLHRLAISLVGMLLWGLLLYLC